VGQAILFPVDRSQCPLISLCHDCLHLSAIFTFGRTMTLFHLSKEMISTRRRNRLYIITISVGSLVTLNAM